MRAPSAAAIRSGRRAEMVFEQTAQPARLRHREPARFGARAAGDVGNRAGVREPEARRGEARVQGAHVTGLHPSEHQVLIHRDADGAVAVGLREVPDHPHLRARHVAERHRGFDDRVAELLLRPHVRRAPARVILVAAVQHRDHHRHDARALDLARGDTRA